MGREVLWSAGEAAPAALEASSSSGVPESWISTGPAFTRNLGYRCSGCGAGEEGFGARIAGT